MRWIGFLPWILVLLITILSSLRIVKPGRRIVLFRLGRMVDIRGPGIRWVIPLIDRQVDIDLDSRIPGWKKMSKERLDNEILTLVAKRKGKGLR